MKNYVNKLLKTFGFDIYMKQDAWSNNHLFSSGNKKWLGNILPSELLNRNLKQGRLSFEENKAVKRMAKKDRVSSELVIFDSRKTKKIAKPKVYVFEKIGKVFNGFIKPQPAIQPAFCANTNSESKVKLENEFIIRNRVGNSQMYPRLVFNKERRIIAHGANIR